MTNIDPQITAVLIALVAAGVRIGLGISNADPGEKFSLRKAFPTIVTTVVSSVVVASSLPLPYTIPGGLELFIAATGLDYLRNEVMTKIPSPQPSSPPQTVAKTS